MNTISRLESVANAQFRELGFRNRALLWNRDVGDVIHVFDFQTHRYAGESATQVTINLGLCHPKVWSLAWGKDAPDVYKETDCCPRLRVGYLLANEQAKYRDVWWTIEDDDEAAVKKVVDVAAERCISYLDRHSNLTAMHAVASKLARKMAVADKIYFAVLNHLLGQFDERDAIFNRLLSRRAKEWRGRIEEVLQRLGLPLIQYDAP